MNQPRDVAVIAALENQARELTYVLWRLERARNTLMPGPADFWRGVSKRAFDISVQSLGRSLDHTITAVSSALSHTQSAIMGMADHG
ncbi:MAG: hypothetical protein ACRCSP_02425 [Rhodoglobus sp.]